MPGPEVTGAGGIGPVGESYTKEVVGGTDWMAGVWKACSKETCSLSVGISSPNKAPRGRTKTECLK